MLSDSGQDPRHDPKGAALLIKDLHAGGQTMPIPPFGPGVGGEQADLSAEEVLRRIQWEKQRQFKLSEGRYTLKEAAGLLSAQGERLEAILSKLMDAARSGVLPVYGPGTLGRYEYGASEGKANLVRDFYEEVYWSDLNYWLSANESRIRFRFPGPLDDGPTKSDQGSSFHPMSIGSVATEAAIAAKPWLGEGSESGIGQAVRDAHLKYSLDEFLAILAKYLEDGLIKATNPSSGAYFTRGVHDPKDLSWRLTPEERVKALALLRGQGESSQSEQSTDDSAARSKAIRGQQVKESSHPAPAKRTIKHSAKTLEKKKRAQALATEFWNKRDRTIAELTKHDIAVMVQRSMKRPGFRGGQLV